MAPVRSGIGFFLGFFAAWAIGFVGIVGEVYACIAAAGAMFVVLGMAFLADFASARSGFYAAQRRWPSTTRLSEARGAWIAYGGGLVLIGGAWLAGGLANIL